MSAALRWRREARDEFEAAARWYARQREGLGDEFVTAVLDACDGITANPKSFAIADPDYSDAVRRARPDRFGVYGVFYKAQPGGTLEILAVLHLHRDPQSWKQRVGE